MPIKGLTDQPRTFNEIGQLRKGAPRPEGGNRPGEDLTYFRATFNEGEDKAAEMFLGAYSAEPQEVNIRLPFNTVDENFDAWQEAYVKGGLIHRCDGEYVQYAVDPQSGTVTVKDGLDDKDNKVKCDGKAKCRPTGRLKVIIPELRRLAFMVVLTTSVWDVLNISRQLEAIRHINKDELQRVPLVLKRRPKEISTPSGQGGKRARRTKWLLSVEADPDWVEAQVFQLPAPEEPPLALPPGVVEVEEAEEPPPWEQKYPESMAEMLEWATAKPYHFTKQDIREAIVNRLAENGAQHTTPEAYKEAEGDKKALAYFWEAIMFEWQLRQAPPPEVKEEKIPF